MVKILDRFFKKTIEPEERKFTIALTELPGWLAQEQIEVHRTLTTNTESAKKTINASIAAIKQMVAELREIQLPQDSPIKLRQVASHSLPSFVSSMDIALSRHLSDDTEEFYHETADLLKSCIKNMKGQGKYIAAVLPREMKEIRNSMDTIGRELNTMTREISLAHNKMETIDELKTTHESLINTINEFKTRDANWKKLWGKIAQDEERLRVIENNIADLEENSDYQEVLGVQESIPEKIAELDLVKDEYAKIGVAAGNLLRKAIYQAERDGKTDFAQTIREIIDLLAGPACADPDRLTHLLDTAGQRIQAMIDSGALVLRNKGERLLFSDPGSLNRTVQDICSKHSELKREIDLARLRVDRSETMKTILDLTAKLSSIREKHLQDLAKMTEYERNLELLKRKFPIALETLNTKIAFLKGAEVEVLTEGADIPA